MRTRHGAQGGFTYVGILFAVVIMGLMLTVAARVWTVTEQRERETQLLFVGDEFRRAIAAYYVSGHQYPLSLQVLLADDRSPVPKRYLRRMYVDPMTPTMRASVTSTAVLPRRRPTVLPSPPGSRCGPDMVRRVDLPTSGFSSPS